MGCGRSSRVIKRKDGNNEKIHVACRHNDGPFVVGTHPLGLAFTLGDRAWLALCRLRYTLRGLRR